MTEWHPILASREREPGRWVMVDPQGRTYGRVELRRVTVDGEQVLRYRCEHAGELIGWATSLRVGCERVHRAHLATMTAPAFPGYPPYIPLT